LNDKGKGETGKMKNPYGLIPHSPKGPEKKEEDPEKMNQDNDICKNLVEHLSSQSERAPVLPKWNRGNPACPGQKGGQAGAEYGRKFLPKERDLY
jgi:hypothetical protein